MWVWSCQIKITPESLNWGHPSWQMGFESPDSIVDDWVVMASGLRLLLLIPCIYLSIYLPTYLSPIYLYDNILHLWLAAERLCIFPLSSGVDPWLVDRAALWLSQPTVVPETLQTFPLLQTLRAPRGSASEQGQGFHFQRCLNLSTACLVHLPLLGYLERLLFGPLFISVLKHCFF